MASVRVVASLSPCTTVTMKANFLPVILSLLWATSSIAGDLVESMSFGNQGKISPNSFAIPGWAMLGEGHVPQLLSDKVILTPPYGGNKRGALWTEQKNTLQDWSVDFQFRAGGQDRAGGNLQLWYVANGEKSVSTSSIYTVGKWDGLAIVIDTVGGVQKIRGFLNDGSVEYKSHQDVGSLAFGHCDHIYRNLGRPSKLTVRHIPTGGLYVSIDERACFATEKINLPTDYNFGMTAASADPPDSFEVFAFTLTSISAPPPTQQQNNNEYQYQQQQQQVQPQGSNAGGSGMFNTDDTPASHFTTIEAQFADLHNRLNLLSKSISNLFTELQRVSSTLDAHQRDLLSRIPSTQSISGLDNRVSNLDRTVSNL